MSLTLTNCYGKVAFVFCIILQICEYLNSEKTSSSKNCNDAVIIEEDIIVSPDLSEEKELKSFVKRTQLWPKGVVYYDYAPKEFNVYQHRIIETAMRDMEAYSCIRFIKKNPKTFTYINFRNIGSGCAAAVGYHPVKGPVDLYLGGRKCHTHGTVQHELLHTLGFWHEHTRNDRDNFIRIEWKNVLTGRKSNFQKRFEGEIQTLGLPYDYGSVLHYRPTAFSKDSISQTIVPLDPKAYTMMGQRIRFSNVDIAKLNRLYKCPRSRYYTGDDITNKTSIIGIVQVN